MKRLITRIILLIYVISFTVVVIAFGPLYALAPFGFALAALALPVVIIGPRGYRTVGVIAVVFALGLATVSLHAGQRQAELAKRALDMQMETRQHP